MELNKPKKTIGEVMKDLIESKSAMEECFQFIVDNYDFGTTKSELKTRIDEKHLRSSVSEALYKHTTDGNPAFYGRFGDLESDDNHLDREHADMMYACQIALIAKKIVTEVLDQVSIHSHAHLKRKEKEIADSYDEKGGV